jgi:hypothetical protein
LKQYKSEKKFNEIKDLEANPQQMDAKKVLMNQGPAKGSGSGG